MAIYNPIRKPFQRVTQFARPPVELTGDAVSRAAAQIEKELDQQTVTRGGVRASSKTVTVDEVRVYSDGQDVGFRIALTPTVLHPGDSLDLKLHLDIT